jgi:hypothetical protein
MFLEFWKIKTQRSTNYKLITDIYYTVHTKQNVCYCVLLLCIQFLYSAYRYNYKDFLEINNSDKKNINCCIFFYNFISLVHKWLFYNVCTIHAVLTMSTGNILFCMHIIIYICYKFVVSATLCFYFPEF